MVKLSEKLSFRLSSLKRIIDHDLIVLKENRVIAEAVFLLENKLIELNASLPHLTELLNLRDDFFKESEKALTESKSLVNIIIYLSSMHIKFDHRCGNQLKISSRVPRNFDSLLQLMFGDDQNTCKTELKNNLIQLTKEIEIFELTIALGKAKLNQTADSLPSLHQTDLLEFKKLTEDLDSLVVRFRSSQEISSAFVEVIETNLDRFKDDLKAVLSEIKHFIKYLRLGDELDALKEKENAKQAELKKRQEQSLDCADLEQELVRLKDKLRKQQESIDEQAKVFDQFLDKLDQNTLSYAERSERHRQITESVIVEKQLSKRIKTTLVKMAKLIDANFKLKYADLNESSFFSNEISDLLFFEIFNALEQFAKERTLIKTKTPKGTS